jgi:hypothetical protein
MIHTDRSYVEWFVALVELHKLKVAININYNLKILPQSVVIHMISQRKKLKEFIKTNHNGYKYAEKINGTTFFLN